MLGPFGYEDVQIVNWLLTRRCNFKCHFCGIVNNEFPELTFDEIKEKLYFLEERCSPFYILYGGEPFLRDDIEDILKLFVEKCRDRFTVYHNGSMVSKVVEITKELSLPRLTGSIDPVSKDKFRDLRAQRGFEMLKAVKDIVEDRVATITIDKTNYMHLEDTVQMLTDEGIVSNITTFDPPGNKFYDFTINDSKDVEQLTLYRHHVEDIFRSIKEKAEKGIYLVHFPHLLDTILDSLPRNYKCRKPWSSLTIDANGSIRLCLRIKGDDLYSDLASEFFWNGLFDQFALLSKEAQRLTCNGCCWTCIMMSETFLDVREHELKATI